ncbi:putative receptor-like protein kinase [Platanthera zijinensis]|uniref:Receptor-like protein kinase n=1 Tax=Platanthera zijinensis TaxID=2320716 RepID=A0AAP0B0M4_9ASPA
MVSTMDTREGRRPDQGFCRMKLFRLLCVTLITLLPRISRAVEKTPLFINCGSDSVITDVGERNWVGDSVADTNLTPSFVGIIASTSAIGEEDRYRNLYKTARIFNTSTHYNFTLASGSYCIRLHFHPFSFESFNANDSTFDVTANDIKLVLSFNVPEEISSNNAVKNLSGNSLVKEYFLNVSSNELIIEFVPVSGSFAFVSAIEIIPAPDHLLVDSVNRVGNPGFKEPFDLRGRASRQSID